jgi:hypothetical protein
MENLIASHLGRFCPAPLMVDPLRRCGRPRTPASP